MANNQIDLITVKSDEDGFLGSDSDVIATINIDESWDAFCAAVRKALSARWPGVEIDMQYGPYGGRSVIVLLADGSDEDEDYAHDVIQDTIGNIYNMGSFWVSK